MNQFRSAAIQIPELQNIKCDFLEHTKESILWIRIFGICTLGSQGEDYGQYLYQKIGLSLLTVQPLAVLVDLQDLEYEYGDRIRNLFQVFSDIRIFGEDKIICAFVISDKNKYGLASLLQFSIEDPKPPFFYEVDNAYAYLIREYDKI